MCSSHHYAQYYVNLCQLSYTTVKFTCYSEFEKYWAQIVVEHQIARELQVLLAWAKISILLVGEETVTYLNHQEDVFSEG